MINVSAVTIGGDSITTSLTLSDPIETGTGIILDSNQVISLGGGEGILIDSQSGNTILQPGTELVVSGGTSLGIAFTPRWGTCGSGAVSRQRDLDRAGRRQATSS